MERFIVEAIRDQAFRRRNFHPSDPTHITGEMKRSPEYAQYSLQSLGIQEVSRRFLSQIDKSPVFFVPGTKHYSFPKAAAILGIGASNMIDVPVDKDARMNIAALKELLEKCLAQNRPVYTVVAVMGSTEESSIYL